jgi:hypothetical protein
LAINYNEWLRDREFRYPEVEIYILRMDLEELNFVMDWDDGVKKVMVEIVQLDPHAWFPKKLVGGLGREYGEGTRVSEDCKSWSELRAVDKVARRR